MHLAVLYRFTEVQWSAWEGINVTYGKIWKEEWCGMALMKKANVEERKGVLFCPQGYGRV